MSAPQRLRDDPAIASELKRDLERCAADDGYDVAAGLERLSATLQLQAPVPSGPVVSPARAPWLVATAVAGVAMVAALWWWLQREVAAAPVEPPPLPVEPTPHVLPAPVVSIEEPPPHSLPVVEPPAPAIPESAPTAPARTPGFTRRSPPPQRRSEAGPATPPTNLAREVDLIAEARRALDSHPQRTLELTQQLAREHPSGALREERDGLAALALWKLGQHEQARARAREFLARYPRSAMRTRIQGIDDGSHK